jgi:hypothetical protein
LAKNSNGILLDDKQFDWWYKEKMLGLSQIDKNTDYYARAGGESVKERINYQIQQRQDQKSNYYHYSNPALIQNKYKVSQLYLNNPKKSKLALHKSMEAPGRLDSLFNPDQFLHPNPTNVPRQSSTHKIQSATLQYQNDLTKLLQVKNPFKDPDPLSNPTTQTNPNPNPKPISNAKIPKLCHTRNDSKISGR